MRKIIFASTFLTLISQQIFAETPPAKPEQPSLSQFVLPENPLEKPIESLPPALAALKDKVKFTYLGNNHGSPAYLGRSKINDTDYQVFYVTPDGHGLIAGVLFGVDNNNNISNETGLQIAEMQRRYKDSVREFDARRQQFKAVEEKLNAQGEELNTVNKKLGPVTTATAPAILPQTPAPNMATPSVGAKPTPEAVVVPPVANTPTAPVTNSAPTPDKSSENVVPGDMLKYVSTQFKTPKEFQDAVGKANSFSVGSSSAPLIYMVADPQCPFCHAAWREFYGQIKAGKLQVRVILIAGLPGSLPMTISLLARDKTVGQAFWQGEGSVDHFTIAAPPSEDKPEYQTAVSRLIGNTDFVKSINLKGTPWLGYVGKDGHVYTQEGSERLSEFMKQL